MTTVSKTLTAEADNWFDQDIEKAAKDAINTSGPIWSAVMTVLDWIRAKVKNYLCNNLRELPVIGIWASRISTSVTEVGFTLISALLQMMKVAFTAPSFWKKAHEMAMKAWDVNQDNGIPAQIYAYSKKMAGYFLEVLKQCFERAIKAKGLEMTEEEKQIISSTLDGLNFG